MLRNLRLIFFCLVTPLLGKGIEVQIETPHAILMNAKTGAILYEKNARSQIFPASTSKIATALYVLKTMPRNLDDIVRCLPECLKTTNEQSKRAHNFTLPAHWLESDGTSAKLMINEEMTLQDLLYGALLCSGNDATNALAHYVCEDIPTFVKRMNEMLKELGCEKSNFCNPHGLHHPNHFSTTYEMALICKEALKYEKFRKIIAAESYPRPKTNKQNPGVFRNTNRLILKDSQFYYPLAIGGKTGSTKIAKFNLVAVAKDEKRELIAVLHKCPKSNQVFQDAIALFDAAFAEKEQKRLLLPLEDTHFEKAIKKAKTPLHAQARGDVFLEFFPSEESPIRSTLEWKECPLPISLGTHVGDIIISSETGSLLLKEPLFATISVQKKTAYIILDGLKHYLIMASSSLVYLLFYLLCLFLFRFHRRRV